MISMRNKKNHHHLSSSTPSYLELCCDSIYMSAQAQNLMLVFKSVFFFCHSVFVISLAPTYMQPEGKSSLGFRGILFYI